MWERLSCCPVVCHAILDRPTSYEQHETLTIATLMFILAASTHCDASEGMGGICVFSG